MRALLLVALVACADEPKFSKSSSAECHPCDPTGGGSEARAQDCRFLSELCSRVRSGAVYLDCKREDVDPVGASFVVVDPVGHDVACILPD